MKLALLFLALIPIVQASILPANCNGFEGEQLQDCQDILSDASLSQIEKEDLYLNLVNPQSDFPSHDFAWNWNNQILFNEAPENIQATGNGIIKNAWLKIVAVNKSVFDANQQKWFVQPFGNILTAKNFGIELPVETLPGECKTDYSYSLQQNQLQVFGNNQLIGSSNPASFSFPLPSESDLNFLSDWRLEARLKTSHFQTQEHCFFDGRHWHCWDQCDYNNTTYEDYAIHLQDFFPTTVLVENPGIQTAIDRQNKRLNILFASDSPLNQLELFQGDRVFSFSNYRYDVNQLFSPYGVLFVERVPEQKIETSFLVLSQNKNYFSLATGSPDDCGLKVLTDFEQEQKQCNSVLLKETRLDLSVDQNSFDRNETIALTARLMNDQNQPIPNKAIEFSSKNLKEQIETSEQGQAVWNLPAIQSNGILMAEFGSDLEFSGAQATKRVPIVSDLAPKAVNVFTVFFAYYFLFTVVKRKLGVW